MTLFGILMMDEEAHEAVPSFRKHTHTKERGYFILGDVTILQYKVKNKYKENIIFFPPINHCLSTIRPM